MASPPIDGAELIARHGVLLQSARGPIPNVAELVVGAPVVGSWWGHPDHDEIFRVLNEAAERDDVVRLRLVRGKLTLVHRRLWPAVVRLADRFPVDRLAACHEEHTSSGAHRAVDVPYPDWVPDDVVSAAAALTEAEALAELPAGVLSR